MEEQFLCPLPCVTVDRIRICHSISLAYIAHVEFIIHQNLWVYSHPIIIAKITLCWSVVNVGQNSYIATSHLSLDSCKVADSGLYMIQSLECGSTIITVNCTLFVITLQMLLTAQVSALALMHTLIICNC